MNLIFHFSQRGGRVPRSDRVLGSIILQCYFSSVKRCVVLLWSTVWLSVHSRSCTFQSLHQWWRSGCAAAWVSLFLLHHWWRPAAGPDLFETGFVACQETTQCSSYLFSHLSWINKLVHVYVFMCVFINICRGMCFLCSQLLHQVLKPYQRKLSFEKLWY